MICEYEVFLPRLFRFNSEKMLGIIDIRFIRINEYFKILALI